MSLIGNIIWLIFGGLLTGLGYILGGLSLCLKDKDSCSWFSERTY